MNNLFNHSNKVKDSLLEGKISIGIFLLSNNSFIAEAIATLPIDWLIIDMEASFSSKEDVLHILQALNGYNLIPLVRVSEQRKHLIEFGLDFGAKGILVPKVDTKLQAEEIIKAYYYPPKGCRGVNPVRASGYFENSEQYFRCSNDCILSIFQIESKESIENINEIAQVPNIDILFIGCGDLASSLGQIGNVTGQLMNDARMKVLNACKINNKIPGIFAYSVDLANQYIKEGFRFIAIGNDIKLIKQGLMDVLTKINK